MFNRPLPYLLIQTKLNKYTTSESYSKERIYRFYSHNRKSCIKYIVSIKEYGQSCMTLDFYPKINLTPKPFSANTIQDLRYRILTKQNSFGYIGATILKIMFDLQKLTKIYVWGFLAASLPNERTNYNNKRFHVYKEILSRFYINSHSIFDNKHNSSIFIIPNEHIEHKDLIIRNYEQIFTETN